MRKVLVSLLVVAMVLGLVGTAYGFSDVTANKYVDKATAFGWLKGYPDGTFKPTGNITRAEAAAVVVRALGLEAAADAAKGLGSKFSDVDASHWASGYVNVCTTKSILKGYPDGTFKPEANITNAEIITMVVRALNRESQAVGEWPIGHITVAAAESIIGTGFASSALATRENVATYVAKASDVKFLKLTTNGWEEDTKTMAAQNDLTKLKDRKVDSTDKEANTITLTDNSVAPAVTKTYDLAANYIISEGKSLRDIEGFIVDAYINDDDDVVFAQIVTSTTSKSGVVKSIGGSGAAGSLFYFYLDNDSKKYELATTATVYRNGEAIPYVNFATVVKVDDTVNFNMEGNLVSTVKATRNDVTDAVVVSTRSTGDISAQYVRYDYRGTVTTKYMTLVTSVTVDGAKATIADVKEDMVVNIQLDPNDTTRAIGISAASKKVSGKVTAKRYYTDPAGDSYWYISIDGVEYRVGGSARVYKTYVASASNGTDLLYNTITVGDSITAYLAVNGRINMADIATATASYGKVTALTVGGEYDKWTVDVKGTAVVYEIDDKSVPAIAATVKPGDYIFMKRNSSGRLIGGVGGTAYALPLVAPAEAAAGVAPVFGDLVTDVLSGDKLIEVNNTTWLTIGDGSVVYVDGEYGSVGAVSKDSRIRYYIAPGGGMKITFAVVDTLAKIDSGLIAAKAGKIIDCQADGVEDNATVEVYATASDATTQTSPIAPAAVTTGALIAPSTTLVQADSSGKFNITLSAIPAGGKAYLRITDPAGNYTVLAITMAP